jgi:hypothetical protein
MPTEEQKKELMKVRPPEEVIKEVDRFTNLFNIPREEAKRIFYKVLVLNSLDEFTDIEKRCWAAFYLMVCKFYTKKTKNEKGDNNGN